MEGVVAGTETVPNDHLIEENPRTFSRVLIIILALAGLGILGYLTYLHYANTQSFCDISAEVSCDVVTTSIYSEIFGIPVSLMGMGYFGLILLLATYKFRPATFQTIYYVALFFLVPALYFTFLEYYSIKSFCIMCESSKAVLLLIMVVAGAARPNIGEKITGKSAFTVFAALTYTAVVFFAHNANVTKEDYTPFVNSLNEKGVVYYKSVKCNNCKRQEQLLGDAYLKMKSVECHPEGVNPQPELCLSKRIDKTPTFTIEVDGVEISRIVGLQSLQDLADWAGVELERQ